MITICLPNPDPIFLEDMIHNLVIHTYQIPNCDLNCMFYADDSQVYVSINPNHLNNDALDTLRQCVEHIFSWNSYAQELSWKD